LPRVVLLTIEVGVESEMGEEFGLARITGLGLVCRRYGADWPDEVSELWLKRCDREEHPVVISYNMS
jgi:hypothetical protein